MRRVLLFLPAACLVLAGCAANTFETLIRDEVAIFTDAADGLARVVDDSSARSFYEGGMKRLKIRFKTHKERVTMWAKYANEEDKKKAEALFKAILGAFKKEKELDPDAFDTGYIYYMANEAVSSSMRAVAETGRIRMVLAKLAERKAFDLQAEWRAAGRDDSPRIGPGLDVDPEKEWPFLYKLKDGAKDLGVDLGAAPG